MPPLTLNDPLLYNLGTKRAKSSNVLAGPKERVIEHTTNAFSLAADKPAEAKIHLDTALGIIAGRLRHFRTPIEQLGLDTDAVAKLRVLKKTLEQQRLG